MSASSQTIPTTSKKKQGIWSEFTAFIRALFNPVKKSIHIIDRGVSKIDIWTAEAYADSVDEVDISKLKSSLEKQKQIEDLYRSYYGL